MFGAQALFSFSGQIGPQATGQGMCLVFRDGLFGSYKMETLNLQPHALSLNLP